MWVGVLIPPPETCLQARPPPAVGGKIACAGALPITKLVAGIESTGALGSTVVSDVSSCKLGIADNGGMTPIAMPKPIHKQHGGGGGGGQEEQQ